MKKQQQTRLLVVEDEVYIREALADKLRYENFTVDEATNGQEGLEMAQKNHPELILLDILMPVMDGAEMIEALRKNAWAKDIPVILLTNLSDHEKVKSALEHTPVEYVLKANLKLSEVMEKIKNLLQ